MKSLLIAVLLLAVPALAQEGEGQKKEAAPEKKKRDLTKLPFSADTVKLVIQDHKESIQSCYNEMLASTKKKAEGTLMTSFVVTPEGVVKNAKVEKKGTTLKDGKLHDCVIATLLAMEFPLPSDKADHPINYPFNLKAVE